jgi:hypothetical protein
MESTVLVKEMTPKSSETENKSDKDTISIVRGKSTVKYIPVIMNGEIVPNNGESLIPFTGVVHNSLNKIKNLNSKTKKNELNDVNKHKVMIVGDSHSRGSTIRLGEYLGKNFEVCGIVKPGSKVVDLATQSNTNYTHLTKNDVIVFQGGSNDVYCNNAKVAIFQIKKFCELFLSKTNNRKTQGI